MGMQQIDLANKLYFFEQKNSAPPSDQKYLTLRLRLGKFDALVQCACCPEVRFIKSVSADQHKQLSNSDLVPQQR